VSVHLPALVVFRHIRQKMCRIECELPENSHHVLSLYLRVNAPTSPVPVLRKMAHKWRFFYCPQTANIGTLFKYFNNNFRNMA
jgi:hypothetical protein